MKASNVSQRLSVIKSVVSNLNSQKSSQETILVTWRANQETILVTW
jgi:hypothetical protein